MESEIWKNVIIDDIEQPYQVSSLGRVISLSREKISSNASGTYKYFTKDKILDGTNHLGYKSMKIYGKSYLIHRLVAIAFLENKDNLPAINHKNGIRNDNRIDNLEWCTYSHNSRHAFDTKLAKGAKGISNRNNVLNEVQVLEILKLLNSKKYKLKEIAKIFNVSLSAISLIKIGINWAWLTGISYRGRIKVLQGKVIDENNIVKEE